MADETRTPILYLAPWVDFGGTDKGTIDWFKWLDRERFAPSLITTQPSLNRRIAEVMPYAEEVWPATDFFAGKDLPKIIFDFIQTRGVEVLHVMNSRMGFDLLPDLAALPRRPAVVVQLHVEEQDKSGYVRYVTTRYGNLVDAFSVTSQHLADAVERYDVPRSKCRVIYTGVDAEEEFAPERVTPIEGLDRDTVQLLYPGRLVEQKDPLLMVDVAAALRDRGLRFQVQVVGEGPLEPDVRRAVSERRLEDVVRFHPPTDEIARWFAACDLLLMTSAFEGVPYVVYEAMAMGVPVVAPALPGNVELMDERCGTLVSPRGHVDGYVAALATFIEDSDKRREAGEHARARVRDRFSLEQMGREHCRLYEELLEARAEPAANGHRPQAAPPREQIRLAARPSRGTPRVTVVVPCFNHGRYLPGCLDSIRKQTYPELEIIVVDDASTEPQTVSLIDELDRHADDVTVIRMRRNAGPSAARNAAIARAAGRYLLPVDADNLLLPEAVERLVNQLQCAGERVGYIYPNLQYFGGRNEYFEAPDYNLHALLGANFADTSSLLDMQVFDAGLRYPEDIRVGHEDWDFNLTLAEHGVQGQPAAAKTLLYRKMGFTRSDVVEYGADLFHDRIVERHPSLFEREHEIKARWSPALSIVPLAPFETEEQRERLRRLAARQSWIDFEVLARTGEPWPDSGLGPALRRLPHELAGSSLDALQTGLEAARGRFVLVAAGDGLDLLEDRGFAGKMMRTLGASRHLGGIAFTDAGEAARFPLQLLRPEDGVIPEPHAVLWRVPGAADALPDRLPLREGDEVGGLTAALAAYVAIQWRHARRPASVPPPRPGEWGELRRPQRSRGGARSEREWRLATEPTPPQLEALRRWKLSATWMPPDTNLICRHVSADGQSRVITNDREPERGYQLEYDVGMVRKFAAPGTSRLVRRRDGSYAALDPDEPVGDVAAELGFVEQAPLPLLDALVYGVHRPTGAHVLVAGESDPIGLEVEPLATLGYVESHPVNPRERPHAELPFRVRGIVRAVDRHARRHVYGFGELPQGELAGELGALDTEEYGDSVPVWLTADGGVITDRYEPPNPRLRPRAAARWTAAPLTWAGNGPPLAARARATARRALEVPGAVLSARRAHVTERLGAPVGFLAREPAGHRIALYAAIHPITGDQLLTPWRLEASDMGYTDIAVLGYMLPVAPVTGSRTIRQTSVPWASRFGQNARRK